jgi:hypothetical protein
MKMSLRRAGVLMLVLIICLSVLGVAMGLWSDTLDITGTVQTGQFGGPGGAYFIGFVEVNSSDGYGTREGPWLYPPDGTPPLMYTFDDSSGLDQTCIWNLNLNEPYQGSIQTLNKDVGVTHVDLPAEYNMGYISEEYMPGQWADVYFYSHAEVIVENVYPCYYTAVEFTIKNGGRLPVWIIGWQVSTEMGNFYFGDYHPEWPLPPDYPGGSYQASYDNPYNIQFVDSGAPIVLQPLDTEEFTLYLHIEQPAEQGHTYNFLVTLFATSVTSGDV